MLQLARPRHGVLGAQRVTRRLRDVHEYILVFSKADMRRYKTGKDTILRDEFLEYTKSIWRLPTESAKMIGHPTPFPVDIPRRLIELYSFAGDVVLDPFCGSETTCVAAVLSGRRYLAYDVVLQYCELARKRVQQAQKWLDEQNLRKGSDQEETPNAESVSAI